jgi:hypothetical protein
VYQGPRGSCLMKKTRGRKSRVRVPLNRYCTGTVNLMQALNPLFGVHSGYRYRFIPVLCFLKACELWPELPPRFRVNTVVLLESTLKSTYILFNFCEIITKKLFLCVVKPIVKAAISHQTEMANFKYYRNFQTFKITGTGTYFFLLVLVISHLTLYIKDLVWFSMNTGTRYRYPFLWKVFKVPNIFEIITINFSKFSRLFKNSIKFWLFKIILFWQHMKII